MTMGDELELEARGVEAVGGTNSENLPDSYIALHDPALLV